MNICLFGATGRTGQYLMKLALHEGHRLTVLVRNKKNYK
jgi:putative NADH-flavin reductase